MRDIWVHVHIPKCGGTSIYRLLRRNFTRKGLFNTNSILNDYQYDRNQVGRIIRQYPKLRCLGGHKLSLDLPYEDEGLNINVIVWVRDPLQRFISHYFYHKYHKKIIIPQAKEMNIDEYSKWALNQGRQQGYIDGQTKFLLGKSTEPNIEKVKELISKQRIYLFPMERIRESFCILNKLHCDIFKKYRIPHLNKTSKDQGLSDDQKNNLERFFQLDRQLHQLAERQLDIHKNNAFADHEELQKMLKTSLWDKLVNYLPV